MSLKALPLLVFNMAGEMCYILDQRLRAQKVKREKARRVMNEIVSTIFGALFLEKLFEPQELPNRDTVRLLFEKLAHSSIMRLSSSSQDKLYDLMAMMFKYQLQNAISPRHLLVITLNHLDGIRHIVHGSHNTVNQVDHAYSILRSTYFDMNMSQLYYIRQTLLNFFNETRVRVCLLLQEKLQCEDGHFTVPLKVELPSDMSKPGAIRFYASGGKLASQRQFKAVGVYIEKTAEDILDFPAQTIDRGTDLGKNIYDEKQAGVRAGTNLFSFKRMSRRECMAKEELTLLNHLIATENETDSREGVHLSIFEEEEKDSSALSRNDEKQVEDKHEVTELNVNPHVRIDVSKPSAETLRLLHSLDISKGEEEENAPKSHSEMILEMLDKSL
ncbi:protein OSCP1 [Trichuris trichiura]|uniref:Protein OSCP1 n=1 Tax=Trichuris trichiura TaxID=36087 RepID=A0A077Z625_TRITR|nr:protein OSCP1 [Trichuris trichiura]